MATAEAKPRRKPRFRYTLRALLVFTTVIAVWAGYHTNRAVSEQRAARYLLSAGAKLREGLDKPDSNGTTLPESYDHITGRIWGERFVTSVDITSPLEEHAVDALASLPHLTTLRIRVPVDATGGAISHPNSFVLPKFALARVLGRCRIRTLGLCDWRISDADFNAISLERSLESLDVSNTNLSEDWLAKLIALPALSSFHFSYCTVTGSALTNVPGSESLIDINCNAAPVEVPFARYVARSPHVYLLAAGSKSIDDSFVSHIGNHPGLHLLIFSQSRLTDDSIPAILKIPSLESIVGITGKLTPEGESRLREMRPSLQF